MKNLKSVIPSTNWAPLKLIKVPNEEIKNDFGGPNYNEKDQEVNILACLDRFSNFPTAEVFNRSKKQNVSKFHYCIAYRGNKTRPS